MRIVVVGAAGGTGRAVIAAARGRGLDVAGVVRRPQEIGATLIVSDLSGDPAVLGEALTPEDRVVCVIGPPPSAKTSETAPATAHLVQAMARAGARRLVVQTGALIADDVDRGLLYRMIRRSLLRSAPGLVADRQAQELVVRDSGMAWTIARPPRLTNGGEGPVRAGPDVHVGTFASIPRASLARWLVDTAASEDHVGQAVVVVGGAA